MPKLYNDIMNKKDEYNKEKQDKVNHFIHVFLIFSLYSLVKN